MKYLLILFLTSTLSLSSYAQDALQRFVQHPALKHASIGVCVKDLDTDKVVVAYNADNALTTASVMKLVTSATALELLGPDFRYETQLALDANDPSRLLIIGSGDPTLGTSAFKENPYDFLTSWAQQLQNPLNAIDNVKIHVVDNLFGYEGVSGAWTWIDMGNYYAPGAYGISVFDNTYHLYFDTTRPNAPPKILGTKPTIEGLSFTNYLTLNNTGRDNGYIYGAPFSYSRVLRGNIPAGRNNFSIKGDIPDPGLLLGQLLASELNKRAIRTTTIETAQQQFVESINAPYSHRVGKKLFSHYSPSLTKILREVNVESNNHFAEHLIRTIGRKQNTNIYMDALDEGVKYINTHWTKRSIATSSLFLYDGSGLAPQNAASAEFITNLLLHMYKRSNYSREFYDTLPIAGKDGTLKYFMNNTKYSGKIRAKSGSIGGVQCFAGYLIDGDKRYAFTIMVNKFTGSRAAVRSSIEKLIESL